MKIEDIKAVLADMACLTDGNNANGDDLFELQQQLKAAVAAENSLTTPPATAFEMQPLANGHVLIVFWASEYEYGFPVGAQVLSGDCFTELAKANPQTRTAVNTLIPPSIREWLAQRDERQTEGEPGQDEPADNSVDVIIDNEVLQALEEVEVASEPQAAGAEGDEARQDLTAHPAARLNRHTDSE